MSDTRDVARIVESTPTLEGAGVRLRRAFGAPQVPDFDPFLLLDDFRGERPDDYEAGFPWHPHRGIETITYMREGSCAHGDSMGTRGVIGPGDAFSEHEGMRVYYCCPGCQEEFEANPKQFLAELETAMAEER